MGREYPATDARGRKLTMMQSALYVHRIPRDQLVVGHLYLLKARNTCVGIWEHHPECINEWGQWGYTYARHKFHAVFLDEEHDFDEEHFATAMPLRDLGPAPAFTDKEMKLAWLDAQNKAHKATLRDVSDAAWREYRGSVSEAGA
jgi:hypothetical protein